MCLTASSPELRPFRSLKTRKLPGAPNISFASFKREGIFCSDCGQESRLKISADLRRAYFRAIIPGTLLRWNDSAVVKFTVGGIIFRDIGWSVPQPASVFQSSPEFRYLLVWWIGEGAVIAGFISVFAGGVLNLSVHRSPIWNRLNGKLAFHAFPSVIWRSHQ